MIEIKYDEEKKIAEESKRLLEKVIRNACPDSWTHGISEVRIQDDASKAKVLPSDGSDAVMDVAVTISDNALEGLEYATEDGPESWEATPLNEMRATGPLPLATKKPSSPPPYDIRDDDDIMEILNAPIVDGDEPLSKEEASINKWAWKNLDAYLFDIDIHWLSAMYTVLKYLKENNITRTNVYFAFGVTYVMEEDGTLFAVDEKFPDRKTPFTNLSISQQLCIAEELLERAQSK